MSRLEERVFWFAWSQVRGLGPILQKRLATHFGSLAAAWEAAPEQLEQVEGIGVRLAQAIAQHRRTVNLTEILEQESPFLTPADDAYPELLYDIPDPPPVLYYHGDVSLLSACQHLPGVGVVGTRVPSDYGKRWTRRITRTISRAGFLIISGLAAGIDREAHRSCLEENGQTIAVLGTGVNIAYPYRNRDLQQAIARSGLLLSEHPPGTQPERIHFPRRNRIIAGLSRATLVMEAPLKSGALITARLANDYGRDVFALPGTLDNQCCYGCLELLSQGAQIVLDENTLITALGKIPVIQVSSTPELPELEPHLLEVFQALGMEARSLDAIVQQVSDQSTGDILSALTHLELMGLVSSVPGTQQYQRC
ncbi:DNA-processing protein DprA [Oscillatoria sp. CS-180]|uniref:DNA-processing protein DprA n=1 Tax=Oscillatoria sp. CS-180 TaxID=3021720 RepID=UPI0023300BCD|nr:DNA-processing protein DprA [Oscillatoria sp. CS-180]MDB9525382.1 DNA-processing protein DprA [Oscillatoria sp. CS-180]